jgi:glycosyltransferase involved in cell wall biosynthesis
MGKPKLIFIVSRFPYPLEKGDKLRAYYQLIELSKKFEVTLIALSEKEVHIDHLNKIKSLCHAVHIIKINRLSILFYLFMALLSGRPLQTGYFFSWKGKRKVKKILNEVAPDHIYCQLIRCAAYVKDYHNCPKTIDYMDALSKGIERRIAQQNVLLKWLFKLEYKRLLEYERTIFDYFENKTIISEQDRDYIFHPEKEKIKVISNGIDPSFFENLQLDKTYDLVFVGNLSYAPNIEAVQYILKFILKNKPDWTCLISGANPNRTIKEMCSTNKNVSLLGWVDDIRESYQKGKVFIAPMMIGTGMQNKLLEAMASGLPCITTKMTNNAIKAEDQKEILVADTPEAFTQIIEDLLGNDNMLNDIGNSGKKYVQTNFSWENVTLPLIQLIESNQTIRAN